MATKSEAVEAKPEVRRHLQKMGAIIVSIGVETVAGGSQVAVGVAETIEEPLTEQLKLGRVPVRLFVQRFGQLS